MGERPYPIGLSDPDVMQKIAFVNKIRKPPQPKDPDTAPEKEILIPSGYGHGV